MFPVSDPVQKTKRIKLPTKKERALAARFPPFSDAISFASKTWTISGSALAPDVRRWLCPAVEVPFTFLGYALGAAYGPTNWRGVSANQGHSPGII